VISSAFVESAVNQVVSKRMVKKLQMRWAPKTAHLLLQVRTRVLNDELGQSSNAGIQRSFYQPNHRRSLPRWPPNLPQFCSLSLC